MDDAPFLLLFDSIPFCAHFLHCVRTRVCSHGRRKPCMLFPIVGEVVTIAMLMVCVYVDRVRLEVVNVVETVFIALSGGWFNMMLGVFSYVADVTTEEERTFRIGIVNLCITLGIPIGMAFSGILLQYVVRDVFFDWRIA